MEEKKIRSSAEEFFYETSAPYCEQFAWAKKKTEKLLKEQMSKRFSSYMKVLIIGNGSGEFALFAAQKTAYVSLCGFSRALLKKTKEEAKEKKLTNIRFQYQDVYKLNYPDKEFDLVILSNCLSYMREPESMLKETNRVLKSKGILIAPNYILASTGIRKQILKAAGLLGYRCYHIWSSLTYKNFIEAHQFQIIESGLLKCPLPIQYLVARKK